MTHSAAGLIAVNGKIYKENEAQVSAFDRGLLFGDGIFEVLVGFGRKILDIEPHLNRLEVSAEKLAFEIPWSKEQLAFEINTLAGQVDVPKKYIRLVITRGSDINLVPDDSIAPNRYIYVLPCELHSPDKYQSGIKIKTVKVPILERGPSAKTANYLRSVLALKKAIKEGYQDVLWTNPESEVTEATRSNVFFIGREGDQVEIATPALQSGILAGITRQTVIRLLEESKIPVTQRIIYADEIPRFDEAFVCSTVRGLMPVKAVNGHQMHTRRQNAVYNHIEKLFLSWVESQVRYRVDWNTG